MRLQAQSPTLFKDLSAKLEAHAHAFKLTDVSYKCVPSGSLPIVMALPGRTSGIGNTAHAMLQCAHQWQHQHPCKGDLQALLSRTGVAHWSLHSAARAPARRCLQRMWRPQPLLQFLDVPPSVASASDQPRHFTRRSFQLQYGASAALHAADVVLSTTALLEAPLPAAAAERADLVADEAVRENYMCVILHDISCAATRLIRGADSTFSELMCQPSPVMHVPSCG